MSTENLNNLSAKSTPKVDIDILRQRLYDQQKKDKVKNDTAEVQKTVDKFEPTKKDVRAVRDCHISTRGQNYGCLL